MADLQTHKQGPAWDYLQKWGYLNKRIAHSLSGYAGIMYDGTGRSFGGFLKKINDWNHLKEIACTTTGAVGLLNDGSVVCTDMLAFKNCDGGIPIEDWPSNIKTISAAKCSQVDHVLGLTEDGKVFAYGPKGRGQCDVGGWRDIVEILAGGNCSIGLRKDGTVLVCGCDKLSEMVSSWQNVEHIYCNREPNMITHTIVGLQSDGKVLVASVLDIFYASHWRDIIDISCSNHIIAGIKGNGDVCLTGDIPLELKRDGLKEMLSINVEYDHIYAHSMHGIVYSGEPNNIRRAVENVLAVYTIPKMTDTSPSFNMLLDYAGNIVLLKDGTETEECSDWQLFTEPFDRSAYAPTQTIPDSYTPPTPPPPTPPIGDPPAPTHQGSDKNTYLILAIVFLFIFLPVSIYFFYKYSKC